MRARIPRPSGARLPSRSTRRPVARIGRPWRPIEHEPGVYAGLGFGVGGLLLIGLGLVKLPNAGAPTSGVAPDVWWTVVGIGALVLSGGVGFLYRVAALRRTYVRPEQAQAPKSRTGVAFRLPAVGSWRSRPGEDPTDIGASVIRGIRGGRDPNDLIAALQSRGFEPERVERLVRSALRRRSSDRRTGISELIAGSALLVIGLVFLVDAWRSAEHSGIAIFPLAPLAIGPLLLLEGIQNLRFWRR
jgi:hypothetical protein